MVNGYGLLTSLLSEKSNIVLSIGTLSILYAMIKLMKNGRSIQVKTTILCFSTHLMLLNLLKSESGAWTSKTPEANRTGAAISTTSKADGGSGEVFQMKT